MKLARKLLSFYLSVIGFIFVFASPSIASAVTQTCGSLYSKENISNKRDRFSEILKEVPEIRSFLLKMIGDPLIPLKIHRILEVSLLQGDISIQDLTKHLRTTLKVPPSIGGVHITMNPMYRLVGGLNSSNSALSLSLSSSDSVSQTVKSKYTVLVPDGYPYHARDNPVASLLHELAHVRFEAFFEKNLERILKNLPPELARRADDGVFEINSDLHDFLHERYAFETQYEFLSATEGRYFPGNFSMLNVSMNKENYRNVISAYVIKRYKLTDPMILRLQNHSVSDLLIGGPFRSLPN